METEMALSADLRWLTYTVLLALVLWIPYIVANSRVRGLSRAMGYPTGIYTDLPDWAQRSQRAHMNMVENLAPFAALVIVAQISGAAGATTAAAAQVFFWARLLHAGILIAGIPWLRTLVWTVGWIACLVILWEILV